MRISDWSSDVCSSDLTSAKSDIPCHFKSINGHFLSAPAPPCQPQSVSPIADRHTRIARGCIGTRYAYIPPDRTLSHDCRRPEAVRPRATCTFPNPYGTPLQNTTPHRPTPIEPPTLAP